MKKNAIPREALDRLAAALFKAAEPSSKYGLEELLPTQKAFYRAMAKAAFHWFYV